MEEKPNPLDVTYCSVKQMKILWRRTRRFLLRIFSFLPVNENYVFCMNQGIVICIIKTE